MGDGAHAPPNLKRLPEPRDISTRILPFTLSNEVHGQIVLKNGCPNIQTGTHVHTMHIIFLVSLFSFYLPHDDVRLPLYALKHK